MSTEKKSKFKRFLLFLSKYSVLFLILIIGLLITNNERFDRAKNTGWAKAEDHFPEGFILPAFKMDLAFDSKDHLWISSREDVVEISANGSMWIYTIPVEWQEVGGATSIVVDKLDNVWIGGKLGLLSFNKHTEKPIWKNGWPFLKSGTPVIDLACDEQGNIWVLTEDHLSQFFEDEWSHFERDNHFSGFNTPKGSFAVDQEGGVWISSGRAVDFLSPDGIWESPGRNISYINPIKSIAFDEQDRLWVMTIRTLSVYDEESISTYDFNNSGLRLSPGKMAFDKDNLLWIMNNYRINVLDIEQVLPVSDLNQFMNFRYVMNLVLSLFIYQFVMFFIDSNQRKKIPEELSVLYILKKLWLSFVVLSIIVITVVFDSFWMRLHYKTTVNVIIAFGLLVPWMRMLSLSAKSEISIGTVITVSILGELMNFFIVWLPLSILGMFGSMQ